MSAEKARDLDETRRLLYAGLALATDCNNVHLTEHATLVGTIANALAHHRGSHYPKDALKFFLSLISGDGIAVQQAWDIIAAITAELNELKETD